MLLRRALWSAGVRYRLHHRDLPGRPDVVIGSAKAAIFCDGDFWHGRHWAKRKAKLAAGWNAGYWVAKIQRNRARDRKVTRTLRQLGWRVIRVWETDVKLAPSKVALQILSLLEDASRTGPDLKPKQRGR